MLPQTEGGPLCCKSPADIYLLLKSSDFISHDLDLTRAYASGLEDSEWFPLHSDVQASSDAEEQSKLSGGISSIPLEVVLKKYVDINPSREWRCFVRQHVLLGISQRDTNFYNFLQSGATQREVVEMIREFWEDEIRLNFDGGPDCELPPICANRFASLIKDQTSLICTYRQEVTKWTLIDFNPYRASSDPLLFTYPELAAILHTSRLSTSSADLGDEVPQRLPLLRVVIPDEAVARSGPVFGTNMMPLEVMDMSQGRSMGDFKVAWDEAVARGMDDLSDTEDDD